MKSQFLKWAVVSSGLLLLAACSANERSTGVVTPVSASAILGGSGSQAEKAEDLANGAELLLSAEGFEQANEMADRALIQDPTNFRARLIHALLAPLVLQKGLIARLRKVAAESPSTNSRYLEIAISRYLEFVLGLSAATLRRRAMRPFCKTNGASKAWIRRARKFVGSWIRARSAISLACSKPSALRRSSAPLARSSAFSA